MNAPERVVNVMQAFRSFPGTSGMMKEAVSAGFYQWEFFGSFPKLQILTIEEILAGKRLLYPRESAATFKRAERQSKSRTQQQGLFHKPEED